MSYVIVVYFSLFLPLLFLSAIPPLFFFSALFLFTFFGSVSMCRSPNCSVFSSLLSLLVLFHITYESAMQLEHMLSALKYYSQLVKVDRVESFLAHGRSIWTARVFFCRSQLPMAGQFGPPGIFFVAHCWLNEPPGKLDVVKEYCKVHKRKGSGDVVL